MHLPFEDVTLIQAHLLATTGREWAIDTIVAQPYYKQIWAWWRALAYYKIRNNYERLEDVPEGLDIVSIMSETQKLYKWDRGKYVYIQETTHKDCKDFYGV